MLEIVSLTLGPAVTNAYLIADSESGDAAVIDPAWDGHLILAEAEKRDWRIANIWLTHAHFDHLGGSGAVADGSNPPPPVALHPEDYWLWRLEGGAKAFGLSIDPGPEPTIDLEHGQILHLGSIQLEVRYAPGHTPGHVMFYVPSEKTLFCGDVIFQSSIGRTDLPGGDYDTLIKSIQEQVLTLPNDTRILNGHGPETTVGIEREYNPFLQDSNL
ncbi:MAG: MBL fold metallo-hydrolase [Chloroflexi bacterium]|nr:MAG: MBL fold metallo-hydrolase [Chloroflexota bacterium]MBL1196679.1 MBL fold metallo-hydrolase [Chloroflexota bacterium]NOH13972.1 MBL fold metallo-hydrolase [Chloroflexota bacterium]